MRPQKILNRETHSTRFHSPRVTAKNAGKDSLFFHSLLPFFVTFVVNPWLLFFFLTAGILLSLPLHAEHSAEQLMDGSIGLVTARASIVQFSRMGEFTKAAKAGEGALRMAQEQYGPVSTIPASILDDLASISRYKARWREAEEQYKWSLAIREKILGLEHPDVAGSLGHLASLYVELARYDEAELLLKRALDIEEKTSGKDSVASVPFLEQLGRLYLQTSRIPQAKASFTERLEILEKSNKPDSPTLATPLRDLAQVAIAEKDFKEAEDLLQRILKIKEKNFVEGHPQIADSQDDLADFYETQGNPEKARELYEQALLVHKRVMGPEIYTSIPYFERTAKTHLALGHYAEAEGIYSREWLICKKVYGPDHPKAALVLADLAVAEAKVPKDKSKAVTDLKESLKILEKNLGENHPLALQVKDRLSKLSTKSKS